MSFVARSIRQRWRAQYSGHFLACRHVNFGWREYPIIGNCPAGTMGRMDRINLDFRPHPNFLLVDGCALRYDEKRVTTRWGLVWVLVTVCKEASRDA